ERETDPLAGARLLKGFLDGPQDISFSETASEVSAQLWTRLRGVALPSYSLEWVRIIRPAGFAVGVASRRSSLAGLFSPLARVVDGVWRRRTDSRNWAALPLGGTGQKAGQV